MSYYPGLVDETRQALAMADVERAHASATRQAKSPCSISHDFDFQGKEVQEIEGPPRLDLGSVMALFDVFFCRRCLQRDRRLVRILQ